MMSALIRMKAQRKAGKVVHGFLCHPGSGHRSPPSAPARHLSRSSPPPAFHNRPSRGRPPQGTPAARPDRAAPRSALLRAAGGRSRGRGATRPCAFPIRAAARGIAMERAVAAPATRGGLSPSAWGQRRRRRREPLQPAAPEHSACAVSSAAWRPSARHCCWPAAAVACHGGLAPSAWGQRQRRRGKPLLPAPLERFAWRAGRIAGCSFRWGLPA
jgi:hypothetical protein